MVAGQANRHLVFHRITADRAAATAKGIRGGEDLLALSH
jgi:hypothetical protein